MASDHKKQTVTEFLQLEDGRKLAYNEFGDQQGKPAFYFHGTPGSRLEAEFTERRDGLWPIYRAKRGYGGRIQRTVGAADRVYNQRLYRLYKWRRSR